MNRVKQPKAKLVADWERLQKIFIRPEDDDCRATLVKYMEQILFGLHEFLNKNVGVTEEISLKELTENFKETIINPDPEKKLADVISDIISQIAPRAVNVASPYFVGHMTAAIPFFMVHLKAIVAALNQNVIKLETSKVLSVLEKQVLAKIHRLVYGFDDTFYENHVQNADTSLGSFTTGGTTANLTALWVARNRFFQPFGREIIDSSGEISGESFGPSGKIHSFDGVEAEGMAQALKEYSLDRAVILVSKRGHFSLKKAGGILGIGNRNVIPIDIDAEHRVDIRKLSKKIEEIRRLKNVGIISVIGVAGATETGIIDPLPAMADICQENGINFHVDAAWGGPVMLSEKYAHKLKGIERADSVTIDGHKQFFMPMTCGMVYFRDPFAMNNISYYSNYVNRQGSVDLGIKTLEGSREANSLILDSALKIMGTKGYSIMIDHGIELARQFADAIKERELFELITEPELNILTYRMVPPEIRKELETADSERQAQLDELVDRINIAIQRKQREAGKSFVSRTRINYCPGYTGSVSESDTQNNSTISDYRKPASVTDTRNRCREVVVLRSVLMNPMTNMTVLKEVLDEQERIFHALDYSTI